MTAHAWTPLWPAIEPRVRAAQPNGRLPRPNSDGWIGGLCSPIREGDTNPSFSVKPDSEHEPGSFKDFTTGEYGSIADLAQRLGVDPHVSTTPVPAPPKVLTLAGFCIERHLDQAALVKTWRVREVRFKNRPALQFPTAVGVDRVKYLDGAKPKNGWVKAGGSAHPYGLRGALALGPPFYLVNGEPSVWACQQAGVAAVCLCVGEGTAPTKHNVKQLVDAGITKIGVIFDLDQVGRDGARAAVAVLQAGGVDATAYELPAHLGNGGDVDDLHRLHGAGLAGEIAKLPPLKADAPAIPKVDWMHRGISAADLQSQTFAQLNWPVANILSEGCTLLAGKPKSKKSWLALGLAIDIARGQPALGGLETTPGCVLYLDLESNQRRMQSRIRAMLGNTPWPKNLHIFTDWPRGEDAIKQLDEWMVLHPDTVCVVGDILKNIRAVREKNANPYDEDYEAVKPFTAWGERNHTAVLMIHHTRKAKADDVFDEISGSTGLSAGVSSMWVMGRLPNSTEAILAIRGRDIVLDDDMALAWDEYACRFTLSGSAAEVSMTQERRSILDAMHDEETYTPKELAEILGRSVVNIKQLLLHLFSDGLVDKAGYGKYVKVLGKRPYGLKIRDHSDHSDHSGNADHTDHSGDEADKSDRSGLKSDRSSPRVITPPITLGSDTDASNSAQNGKSDQSDRDLKNGTKPQSDYSHDKQREHEAMAALARNDYKAARRAASHIRGRKEQERVEETIDSTERERKTNGGYGTPQGYGGSHEDAS